MERGRGVRKERKGNEEAEDRNLGWREDGERGWRGRGVRRQMTESEDGVDREREWREHKE